MIDRIRRTLTYIVIPIGIVIMQSHSVPFWYQLVRWQTGIWWLDWIPAALWSIGLELISIWQWLQPKAAHKKWFGMIVTLLLLGGPLYQTVTPVYIAWTAHASSPTSVTDAERNVKYFKDLIASGRRGFLEAEQNAEAALNEAQEKSRLATSQPILFYAKAIAVALSMIVFTYAVVLGLNDLSGLPVVAQVLAVPVRRLMQQALNKGASVTQVAIRCGISVSEVEAILNGAKLTRERNLELMHKLIGA